MRDHPVTEIDMEPEFTFELEEPAEQEGSTTNGNASAMPRVLRALGAAMVVAAASTFLFQRWGSGSDLQRYLMLLGFTAILSLGGFFCGIRLRETKGARTLLGLTLGLMPINFAVIAGLIYSRCSWDGPLSVIPAYASWVAPSPWAALSAAAGGFALLAPLGHLSFRTLGREHAGWLTGAFLAGNLALWLPTRQPGMVGVLIAALAFALGLLELRRFRHAASLATFEGRLSRLLLWVPLAIMAGRTVHLYAPSDLFNGCLLAVAAAGGFLFAPCLSGQRKIRGTIQSLSLVPATLSWFCFAQVLIAALPLGAAVTIPLLALPVALLLMGASFLAESGGSLHRRLSLIIALAGTAINLVAFPGPVTSLVCLATAAAVLVYGFIAEQKSVLLAGCTGLLLGLGYQLKFAVQLYSVASWGGLAVIGLSIIITASLLERHQGDLRQRIGELRSRLQRWNG